MVILSPVYAQVDITKEWSLAAIPEFQSLGGLVGYLLPKTLIVAGVIFFILIVLAGLGMIRGASSGDPHASEQAKQYLTYAVIGLIIVFGAFWILQIINYLTNNSLSGPEGIL